MFADLAADRLDVVVDSVASTVARFQTTPIEGAKIVPMQPDPQIPVSAHPGQVNWPTSKDNADLTSALNAQITAMRADGTIAATLQKYGVDAGAAEVGEPAEL